MTKKERYQIILEYLKSVTPSVDTELNYSNPFELLVAVVLSAQCTDKRVNLVTPQLFCEYPTPELMSLATSDDLFPYIRSVSYPNNKSKHLVGLAKMLVENFESQVPSNLDDLVKLPGVGRKTANVILALVYNKAAMPVDTHVFRVSHRLGLVPKRCTTPRSVEIELSKNIPQQYLSQAHFWLLYHGRYTCIARKPKCEKCKLTEQCSYYKREFIKDGRKITL